MKIEKHQEFKNEVKKALANNVARAEMQKLSKI
jgi:hypothetical protein